MEIREEKEIFRIRDSDRETKKGQTREQVVIGPFDYAGLVPLFKYKT
jgi:hypothetical protein